MIWTYIDSFTQLMFIIVFLFIIDVVLKAQFFYFMIVNVDQFFMYDGT